MGFEVQRGVSGFERSLERIEKTFERPTEFTRDPFVEWLAETEREQFGTGGGAGKGGRWQPSSRATLKRKAAAGRSLRILEGTGAMRELLTRPESLSGLIQVSGDRIIFRLPEPAGFHQRGTSRMPARRVFDPSARQVERLGERVGDAAAEQLRRAGIQVKRS